MSKLGRMVGLCVALAGLSTGLGALAGDGTLRLVPIPAAPGKFQKVSLRTGVYLDQPRTPAEMAELKKQFEGAAQIVCDYSEGLVSIDEVRFGTHSYLKRRSDIIAYRRDARAWGGHGTGFGVLCNANLGPITVGGCVPTANQLIISGPLGSRNHNAQTIAHELAHLVFNLADQYPTNRPHDTIVRSTSVTARPSFGLGGAAGPFFLHPIHASAFSDLMDIRASVSKRDGTPLYQDTPTAAGTLPWWTNNHTVLQSVPAYAEDSVVEPQVCRRASDQLSPGDVDPLWLGSRCMKDEDCARFWTGWNAAEGKKEARAPDPATGYPGDFSECLFDLPHNSELSVAANDELDRFNLTRGEQSTGSPPAGFEVTPFLHPGRQLVIAGFLYPSTDAQVPDIAPPVTTARDTPSCPLLPYGEFPSAMNDPGVEFQCVTPAEGFVPCPGRGVGSSPAAFCEGCVLTNTVGCGQQIIGACGNGNVDIDPANQRFEQCDTNITEDGVLGGRVLWDDPDDETAGLVPLGCEDVFSNFRAVELNQTGDALRPSTRMTGGEVRCQTNCMFDLSACALPIREAGFHLDPHDSSGDDRISLWEASQVSTTTLFAEVFDEDGVVEGLPNVGEGDFPGPGHLLALAPTTEAPNGRGLNLDEMGTSNHGVFAFFRRLSRYRPLGWPPGAPTTDLRYNEVWSLTLAIDQGEEQGGEPGLLAPQVPGPAPVLGLRTFRLEFAVDYVANTSTLFSVNGVPFNPTDDPATWPPIYIDSSTTQTDAWGTVFTTFPLTPPRAAGLPDLPEGLKLPIDLRNLYVRRLENWDCSTSFDPNVEPLCSVYSRGTFTQGPPRILDADKPFFPIPQAAGAVQMYARHGTFPFGVQAEMLEAPQYPNIRLNLMKKADEYVDVDRATSFFFKYTFNPELLRYESAQPTIDQLAAAHCQRVVEGGKWKLDCDPADNPEADAADAVRSDWELVRDYMLGRYDVDLLTNWVDETLQTRAIPEDADEIAVDPPPPAACGAVQFSGDDAVGVSFEFDAQTQVVFLIDRGQSTGQYFDDSFGLPTRKRLDHFKSAAHLMFQTFTPRPDPLTGQPLPGPRVGLVYYETAPELALPANPFVLPVVPPGGGSATLPCDSMNATAQCVVAGTHVCLPLGLCKANNPSMGTGISLGEFYVLTVPSDGGVESPEAGFADGGDVAALRFAKKMIDHPPSLPTTESFVFHFHDEGPVIGVCDSPGDPLDGANCQQGGGHLPLCPGSCDALAQREAAIADIQSDPRSHYFDFVLHADGVGDADAATPASADQALFGESPLGEDMIPLAFEAAAALRGQALVLNHHDLPELRGPPQYPTKLEYRFRVEEDAERLQISISDFDASSYVGASLDAFVSAFTLHTTPKLVSPSGAVYPLYDPSELGSDVSVELDSAFALVSVEGAALEPGEWMFSHGNIVEGPWFGPVFHVSSFVHHPTLLPDCSVSTEKRVYGDGESVVLIGRTGYERDVTDGASFEGFLTRPDKILVPLSFARDPQAAEFRAEVAAADLGAGTGQYVVSATCHVAAGAKLRPGERIDIGAVAPEPEPLEVPEFSRSVRVTFQLDSAAPRPVPGVDGVQDPTPFVERGLPEGFYPRTPYIGDCDRDGIPNSAEPDRDVDSDADGIPDICDSDANDNGAPDGTDPDYQPGDPDGDQVPALVDNCDDVPNPDQTDTDGDGLGDACDDDDDDDGVLDPEDNCPLDFNPGQEDFDDDGLGDACDDNSLVADAGPDQVVECTGSGKATVTLDGTGSTAPSGSLSYAWSVPGVTLQNANQPVASGAFPLGTKTVTLTVSQGGLSDQDTALVIVLDTTPPILTVPPDVTKATCTGVTLGLPSAVDGCGSSVTIVNDAPASFKAGTHTVTWRAIDQFGNQSVKTQKVTLGLGDGSSCCPAGTNVIQGTSNNDLLNGTSGADCILGKGAQDTIKGFGGNDFLSGGEGNDVVEGGDGNDFLDGGTAQDTLRGQNGNDTILSGDGDDWCYGGNNDDTIRGGQGQDHLFGESGNDSLFGDIGDDVLDGGPGNDFLNGGGLHDQCFGGTGTNIFVLCGN